MLAHKVAQNTEKKNSMSSVVLALGCSGGTPSMFVIRFDSLLSTSAVIAITASLENPQIEDRSLWWRECVKKSQI